MPKPGTDWEDRALKAEAEIERLRVEIRKLNIAFDFEHKTVERLRLRDEQESHQKTAKQFVDMKAYADAADLRLAKVVEQVSEAHRLYNNINAEGSVEKCLRSALAAAQPKEEPRCVDPHCACHTDPTRRVLTPFPTEYGPSYCCSLCSSTRRTMPLYPGGPLPGEKGRVREAKTRQREALRELAARGWSAGCTGVSTKVPKRRKKGKR